MAIEEVGEPSYSWHELILSRRKSTSKPLRLRFVRIASDVRVVSPWTHDQAVHLEAIAKLAHDGATLMNDALRMDAQEQMNRSGNKITILFTDGKDSSNRNDIGSIIATYRQAKTQLHIVALNNGEIDEPLLRRLATETDGSFQTIANAAKITTTIASLANRMKAPVYCLTILLPNMGKSIKLSVGEMLSVGRLTSLSSLAKLGRSKGNRLIIAAQTISGLRDPKLYGQHGTDDLLGNFGNRFFGRTECAETAEYASKIIGDQEVMQPSHVHYEPEPSTCSS